MHIRLPLKIFLILTFLLALAQPVSAIEYGGLGGKPAYPDNNIERSKSIFVYTLEPGAVKEDGVLVINNTQETKNIVVYSTDSDKGSDGSFACEQFADVKDAVGSWIELEEEITLGSMETQVVPFTVKIPENASVGEENGCIMIQEKEQNSTQSGVSLSFRTGLRVAITIPGEQIRELEFKSLNVTQKSDGVIAAKVDLENKGNVSIDTDIKLKTNYIFGLGATEINNEYPVLRGEVATFNFELPKPFWGGFITVAAQAEYDDSSEAGVGVDTETPNKIISGGSYTFFSFPEIGALIIEIMVVILLAGLIVLVIRKKRQSSDIKNTWVDYRIRKGEHINTLAETYGIEWKQLTKVNKLKPPYLLSEGDVIKVPPKSRKF